MRDILFRGKRTDNGEWVYGYVVSVLDKSKATIFVPQDANNFDWAVLPVAVDPDTVGQYTGLVDRNGNDVYESDILRNKTGYVFGGVYDSVVIFGGGKFYGENNVADLEPDDFRLCEIVGNKFDNPELLS